MVFRGSTTGVVPANASLAALKTNARLRLALHAAAQHGSPRWDVGVTSIVQLGPDAEKAVVDLGLVRPALRQADMLAARATFDVDGNSNAWDSCWWKLRGNAVVLKVQSKYQQWYYPKLVAWVHYIPVRADLSDVDAAVDFALDSSNDPALVRMAAASTRLLQGITYAREADRLHRKLAKWRRRVVGE